MMLMERAAVADAGGREGLSAPSVVASWWIVWTLLALAVAEAPLVLAACCGPEGLTGIGTFWFVNDFAQYESAMRQGAESSSWLVFDRFTPEPHDPALMFTAYVALGKLAALLGLQPTTLYRSAELLARIAFLVGIWRFVSTIFDETGERRLAATLLVFGMGLGVPLAIVGAVSGTRLYTGNGSYEVNSFGLLFSAPHAALAMGLTLWLVARVAARRASKPIGDDPVAARSLALLVLAALCGTALALLHPFHLLALFGGLGVYALLCWFRASDREPFVLTVAAAAGATPVLVYDMLTFGRDPFWAATYSVQNLLPTPAPWEMLVEYGVVLLFAVPGLLVARRRGGAVAAVLCWLILLLVLSYVPVPFQRRLGFGLQPALAVVGTIGLSWAASRVRPGRRGWVTVLALLLAFATTATVMLGIVQSALAQSPLRPYRADVATAAVTTHLAAVACSSDVVLANWDVSNYLGGRIRGRVVGGHPVATLDAVARKTEINAAGTDPQRWGALVERFQPQYVLYSPLEAGLPPPAPHALEVFRSGNAVLYAVGRSACA